MKYTLAQYLRAVELGPFSKDDFYSFAGVTTENPLIGYGDYGPNGPVPYPRPSDEVADFVLIVDGNDIQVINDGAMEAVPSFFTATADWR